MDKRSHKQNPNNRFKEEARASQREVGGGTTRRLVGLSNHTGRPTEALLRLAYGMDAIISLEIGLPTIRTKTGQQDDANAKLGRNLDWTVRETASIRMIDYQQRATAHYNRKARPEVLKWYGEDSSKNYKKKSSHWEGLPRSFSSSPGGIEGTSRLIPCFFIQQRSCISTNSASNSFFDKRIANPLSFSLLTPLSGDASLLPHRANSPFASCRRASVDSSRLFASTSSIRRASLSSWDFFKASALF
ncbi:hypothetical protein AAG906_039128 [Vitis piasezkii]